MGPELRRTLPLQPAERALLALKAVRDIDPDQHAEGLRLSELLGLTRSDGLATAQHAKPSDREALRQDYRALLQDAPRLGEWLANTDHAGVAKDDLAALRRLHDALQRARPERSWFGELEASAGEGLTGLESTYYILGATQGVMSLEDAAAGIAAANRSIAESQAGRSAEVKRYFAGLDSADGLDVIPAAFSSAEGFSSLVASNLANALPSLALGYAGGKAGLLAGGAAGSVIPGAGTAAGAGIGGTIGAAGGAFVGGVLTEYGAWVNQELGAAGYDMTDPGQVLSALRRTDLMERVTSEATAKGLGTGAFDALSTFVGGRVLRRIAGAGTGRAGAGLASRVARKVVGGAAELAVEGLSESAGEAAGQYAAKGEIDVKDVLLEGIASFGQAPVQVLVNRSREAGGQAARSTLGRFARAAHAKQAAAAVSEAVLAFRDSQLWRRLPSAARDFVESQLGSVKGVAPSVRIDIDAWNALMTARGRAPATEAARLGPDGGRAYAAALETGELVVPFGAYLEAAAADSAPDELVGVTRFSPDGMTLQEAEAHLGELQGLEQELATQAGNQATLYQEQRQLREEVTRLDQEIGRLERSGAPEAEDPAAGEVPRGTGAEAGAPSPAAAAQLGAVEAALTLPAARRRRAEAVSRIREIDETVTGERTVREQLQGRIVQGLVAAGQSHATAQASSQALMAFYETRAQRRGEGLAEYVERRQITVARGNGQPQATAPASGAPATTGEEPGPSAESAPAPPPAAGAATDPADSHDGATLGESRLEYGNRDLFDQPLHAVSDARGGPADGRGSRRSATPVPDGAAEGLYATSTRMQSVGSREVPATPIIDLNSAAAALGHLGDHTEEHVEVLVTDAAGKPLAVVGVFKGKVAEAVAPPGVIAAEAIRVPGAAGIWLGHNHPSGTPNLSKPDLAVRDALANLLQGSGISMQGLFAIGEQGSWEGVTAGGARQSGQLASTSIPDTTVSVVERRFEARGRLSEDPVVSVADAVRVVPELSGGESGVLLFDAQQRPVAFIGVDEAFDTLRGTPRHAALLRSLSHVPALGSLVVDAGLPASTVENLTAFLNAAGTPPVDVVEMRPGEPVGTWRWRGREPSTGVAFHQPARGSTEFGDLDAQGRRVFDIRLFARANRSTWFHELGHTFLEILGDDASLEDATEGDRADYAKALAFMGLADREAHVASVRELRTLQATIRAEARKPSAAEAARMAELSDPFERFARGFEAYLREGKAPSQALRRVFATFASWLRRIYREALDLDVELTDEVREVMDRLLATDEEIEAARYDAGADGLPAEVVSQLTDTTRHTYNALLAKARDEASERLTRDALKSRAEQLRAERGEALAKIREQVLAEIDQEPGSIALAALRDGTLPDGSPRPGDGRRIPIARDSVEDPSLQAGFDALGVLDHEGDTLAGAMEYFGFQSPESFLEALGEASVRERRADRIAFVRFKAAHPELLSSPAAKESARRAVANYARSNLLFRDLQELRRLAVAGLSSRAGERRLVLPATLTLQQLRKMAQLEVDKLPVGQIRPLGYLQAARRMSATAVDLAREAVKAEVLDERQRLYAEAAKAKQREIMNHELYRIASKAVDAAEVHARRIARMQGKSFQERLGQASEDAYPSYRAQLNALLARFGLAGARLIQDGNKGPLSRWLDTLEAAEGLAPDIVDWILDESVGKNWRDLTSGELQDVRDAVEQIYHAALHKGRFLAAERKLSIEQAVALVVHRIRQAKKKHGRGRGEQEGWLRGAYMAHRIMDSVAREIDAEQGGPLWEYLIRKKNQAQTSEIEHGVTINKALRALFDMLTPEDRKAWSRKAPVEGVHEDLSLEQRLFIALNHGNKEGRDRLANSFTAGEVAAVLRSLNQRHADMARAIWELEDSFWPAMRDLWLRVKGVHPPKVEAIPFETIGPDGETVTWRGGYHRLKYDGVLRTHQQELDAQAQTFRTGQMIRATTKAGSTKERLEKVGHEVRLDFGVLTEHLAEVAHLITHFEPLRDLQAVLLHRDVHDAFTETIGTAAYRVFTDGYKAMARGTLSSHTAFEQIMGYLRAGTIAMRLGLRVTTNLINVGGFTQSMVSIGPGYALKALGQLIAQPHRFLAIAEEIAAKSPAMANRASTFQREISEQRNRFRSMSKLAGARSWIQAASFAPLAFTQLLVDVPTWMAAYAKAIDQGETDEQRAIELADQAVVHAQGGGQVGDMSELQRGNEWQKVFTTFYGYSARTMNLTAESFARTDWKTPAAVGRWASEMVLLFGAPAVWAVIMQRLLRGDEDDDEPFAEAVAREAGSYVLGQYVILREFGGMALGINSYGGPAGSGYLQEAMRLAAQVGQGEADEAAIKAALGMAGIAAHLPTTQLTETYRGVQAWLAGEAPPTAAILGPPRGR